MRQDDYGGHAELVSASHEEYTPIVIMFCRVRSTYLSSFLHLHCVSGAQGILFLRSAI